MKIDRLSFKGILRFQEPITLDFREVPPGIVAVTGVNGAGKTTILESMFAAHYGTMPSRTKRPLVDLVNGNTDAFIQVESSFDSGRFRARMNLDGTRRKTDATLEAIDDAGVRIGDPLNDGKVSTYEKEIAARWPKPEAVLASAFAAQNKEGSFSSLDRKGKKDLFTQLLGLEQLEAYATTARAAAAVLDRRRTELQAQIDVLRPMTTPTEAAELSAEGDCLQVELAHLELVIEANAADVRDLEASVETQRAVAARGLAAEQQHDAHVRHRAERARALLALGDEHRTLDARTVAARVAINDRLTRALADTGAHLGLLPSVEALDRELFDAIDAINARRATREADLQRRIGNNRGLIDRESAILSEVDALDALERSVEDLARTAAGETQVVSDRSTALAVLRRAVDRERHWPAKLEAARRAAELITTVPFGNQCAEAGCGFVKAAVDARASIPECEAGVERLRYAEVAYAAGDAALTAASEARGRTEVALETARRSIRDNYKDTRATAAALAEARTRIVERESDLASAIQEADDAIRSAEAHRVRRGQEMRAQRAQLQDAATQAQVTAGDEQQTLDGEHASAAADIADRERALYAELLQIDAQIGEFAQIVAETTDAAAELSRRETALGLTRADLANQRQRLATLTADVRAFQRRRDEFRARLEERQRLEAAAVSIDTELIEWQALARVFGREGLPVLEIDAAGPHVSALANDLLQSCFSGRFTVELVTQEAKAGGKGLKEAFDIQVWDAERGGDTRSLSDLSGGEQVIVDEAIKSAIAIFCNSRNVLPIRTCWRDESAGALDPENAQRYLLMLRRIRERGGFHHLFIVVHSAEIAQQADAQIVVRDGTATIVYPPFQAVSAA